MAISLFVSVIDMDTLYKPETGVCIPIGNVQQK